GTAGTSKFLPGNTNWTHASHDCGCFVPGIYARAGDGWGGGAGLEVASRARAEANRQGAARLHDYRPGPFLMTPLSHTIFGVGLFLALVALWLWSQRRRRVS